MKARQTNDRWKAFWDFFSTLLVWFWTASIDDQSKNRPFAWPDFNFNVHFISIKNILICSLQFKRGWSLNLGPTIFLHGSWIEFQTKAKVVCFLNQLKFHTFRQPRVLSAVKTENMGKGNLPNDTLLLPVCPLLNLHNPIFPIENFIHSILRLHLVRAGALHASRRARWARWQELEFAEVDAGQKWMFFPPHLHPSTPRLSALFAQVLKSASRAH